MIQHSIIQNNMMSKGMHTCIHAEAALLEIGGCEWYCLVRQVGSEATEPAGRHRHLNWVLVKGFDLSYHNRDR